MAHLQQSPQILKDSGFINHLDAVAQDVEKTLDNILPPPNSRLHEAMRYSVLGGGKRLRSFVLYEAASLFDVSRMHSLTVAAAIEIIQAYSLVHDDLPCMDDADLRRGKPSCHVAFGEATATLVGDALIPLGFQTLCSLTCSADIKLDLIESLAQTIGSQGLAAGQMMDLRQEAPVQNYNDILELERLKTGVFFGFAAEAGAILGGSTTAERNSLKSYGLLLGEAFQMRDDFLDGVGTSDTLGKPSGQDTAKLTFYSLLGPELLSQKAEEASHKAIKMLGCFGEKAAGLRNLAHHAVQRVR